MCLTTGVNLAQWPGTKERMDLPKFLEELLVVIVLFKSKPEKSAAYTSIQNTLKDSPFFPVIFLYNNGPEQISLHDTRMLYLEDLRNSGVSKAYNRAAALAGKEKKKWMLLLDQDTRVEVMLFEKFAAAIATHPESKAFVPRMHDRKGMVSPFYFASGRGRRIRTFKEKCSLTKFRFINSGLLISIEAFLDAGGYDERIPLDFSDIAFGDRLSQVTDHFRVIDASLEHAFSATSKLPMDEAMARFYYFCIGAEIMGKNSGQNYRYFMRALLHGLHLSIHYKNFAFVKIFFKVPTP